MRSRTVNVPGIGVIAAAIDDQGNIVATASASESDGIYMAVDEGAYFAATGDLLPAHLWDQAVDEEPLA